MVDYNIKNIKNGKVAKIMLFIHVFIPDSHFVLSDWKKQ